MRSNKVFVGSKEGAENLSDSVNIREDREQIKEEFNEFRREVLSRQDKMMTILARLDQERIFATEWIRKKVQGARLEVWEVERLRS